MSDPMQGIEEDVPFDFGAAESLVRTCTNAATQVDTERGSHVGWVTTAMSDFKGHFSQLFQSNGTTADGDASELSNALRQTAVGVDKLIADARAEQKRRDDARAWKKHHDNRGFGGWLEDTFGSGDDCPIPPAQPQLQWTAPTPPATPRQNPAPGAGGGGGGGTSSARPSNLHTFASQMNQSHGTLSGTLHSVSSQYATFQAGCQWGRLSADGVLSGFSQWLGANENDARWAKVVGDAFAAAGGEGAVSTLPNSAIHSALQAAGVDESRTDLTIAMPSVLGHPPTTGYANDPVNTSTGNFVESEVDLEFTDACSELWWRRCYNSMNAVAGALGTGWSTWADTGLLFTDEHAAFVFPDGRQVFFPRLGDGWDRAVGESYWLTRGDGTEGERLLVSGNDGQRWECAPSGRLLRHSRGEGRGVELTWTDGRLTALTHDLGRSITVEWAGDRAVAVVASDGRRFDYTYEADRLVAATGPLGTRRYTWNDEGLVASVTDADGVVEVANEYDARARVVRQRSPFGRVTRFAYLPGRVTVVSDDDGTRANTWIADERGRLVGVLDAHDRRQSMAYDSFGNKVMVTERDGSVLIRQYDERGRRVRQTSPDGADITFAYDDLDRVTRVEVSGGDPLLDPDTDPATGRDSVTTYEYTGAQRDPSVVTDPEGGRTELEWRDGLLTRLVDPMGVVVRFEHDPQGDLVATTDAEGNTARLERDATGRVTAAVAPSGARTTFAFDAVSGLVSGRTDPDGATWHYEYSTAARVTAVVDPTGGRTELEYGAHGEESATIDALGRALRRTYDDLGFVSGAELPDGSRWEFAHDALGRLTEVIDAAGGRRTTSYDVDGAPTATTDPTGVRREVREVQSGNGAAIELVSGPGAAATRLDVDKLGRLASETQSDGSTRLTRYDRCGRPVEVVDPHGGLTRLVRDRAGRVLTLVRPSGAEIGYTYDRCGRLETITDETGATSRRVYDADGHVVEQHLPTGDVATTRFDSCGRVVAVRVPGVGTSTYAYDLAGRVVETRDPSNGRRRFRYDAAGQLVEAVDGTGGRTRYDYDANGRCHQITHPDGGRTRREYDRSHHVVAETDPLGRTTTAEYDGAGRQTSQTDPDGRRTEWRYDAQGRLASTWVDGVEQSSIERRPSERRVRITDRSGPDGAVVVHELQWDARGLLVSRTRDGRGAAWEYDADGACTALVAPDGTRTSYARDGAGRLVGVSHPVLGTAVMERDGAGRVVSARAGGLAQRWSYADGFVVAHEVDGVTLSRVTRTEEGRVERVETRAAGESDEDARSTSYGYDEACQLISATTRTRQGSETVRWRYDASGRLVAESQDGLVRQFDYDAAGQLTGQRRDGVRSVGYAYDGAGRRIAEEYADGSRRDYTWGAAGWLSAISATDRLGDTRRTDLVVDALGELARIDGPQGSAEVVTDSANRWQGLISVGDQEVVHAGPFTGSVSPGSAEWADPSWRDARSVGPDPWTLPTAGLPELPDGPTAGFEVTPTGDLLVGGMEWLGNRVYDSATRGFLSVDPLDPTTGAGWSGNPYSYAGNDPMHALDPMGLHPVTDAELRAYNAHNGGFMDSAAGKWLKNNWEYVAAGAMVIGGAALMFVPGGQAFGLGLMSAGIDTATQKALTGHVNWGEVAISGALGMVGGVGEGAVAKLGMTGWKAAATAGAIDGAWQGAAAGGGGYLLGPGPHTASGFLETAGIGTLAGAGGGAVTGSVTHSVTALRHLGDVAPTPEVPALPAAPEHLALPAGSDLPAPYKGQPVYRVYGGDSAADGASWSPVHPGNVPNYRDAAGLPSGGASGYDNTGRFVIEGTLHDPSAVVKTRAALPLDGNKGGVAEYIIPHGMSSGAISVDRVSGVNPQF